MIQNYNIKNKFKTFSLLNSSSILWTYGFSFLKSIEVLLFKKNIIVTKKNLHIISNTLFLDLELFFLTNKISKFRKKLNLNSLDLNKNTFLNFIIKQFTLFKINTITFDFKIINFKNKKAILFYFFKKFKKVIPTLFNRRFTLFIDFIKIFSLLSMGQISSKIFLLFLQKIFKNLTKKQHSQFLSFLKLCFKVLIYDFKKLQYTTTSIKGIKLIISGKLKGKPRSSSSLILVGNVSTQTFNSKIDYSKIHVYTLYGVFGIKIWISY
jgi:hypothetical protein